MILYQTNDVSNIRSSEIINEIKSVTINNHGIVEHNISTNKCHHSWMFYKKRLNFLLHTVYQRSLSK